MSDIKILNCISEVSKKEIRGDDLSKIIEFISKPQRDTKFLILVLGLLGDFDSLEYIQDIVSILPRISTSGIQLQVIGIGTEASKRRFSVFTGLPENFIAVVPDNSLHRSLGLYVYPENHFSNLLNLILMCLGIGSPGTLKEVLRGYTGDRKAMQCIANDELVRLGKLPPFSGSIFKAAGGEGFQRPFEKATLRLINMIEVVNNWKTYMFRSDCLTQRGGTFLVDQHHNLIYSHYTNGILCYSETMYRPLAYLDKHLNHA